MPRKARHASRAPRLESLEGRLLLSGTGADLRGQGVADPSTSLFVRFQDGTPARTKAAILDRIHGEVVVTYPDGPSLVRTSTTADHDLALKVLPRYAAIRYVEADGTLRVDATIPNDPGFSRQWGLDNPNDVDIDAPQAWDGNQGSPSTIVAVIDSGLDLQHPEFAGRLWTNAKEAAGVSGVDDDGDGLVDDVHGWNFLTNTSDINDDNDHGTHVTGIIAATGNNGIGDVGVDWNAKIMPLKFIGNDGNGSVDDAIRAVYYAVDHGARVINASWGGGAHVRALTDAINYANSRNVVFVTAAGNEGANNNVVRSYPADDRLPNVISVAAVDSDGNLPSFSNYGSTTVDLAAPGVNIRSMVPGGYATFSGSSMAAPYVTGVVSLLVAQHPELSAAQIVRRVVTTAKPLPGLQGRVISGGIVDAANALSDSYAAAHSGMSAKPRARLQAHRAFLRLASRQTRPKLPARLQGRSLGAEV